MDKLSSKMNIVVREFSVCIPIYNCNVVGLVSDLHTQAELLRVDYEILLIDDCSLPSVKAVNSALRQLPHVQYIELEQNIGRSAIRNLLARRAAFDMLIFMDCDAKVVSHNYLAKYLSQSQQLVVGGVAYDSAPSDGAHLLRWLYGKHREERSAAMRSQCPNKSFSTFNFMINRGLFGSVKFDDTISGYGHEDTLFGWQLKQHGIQPMHIDNALIHLSFDESQAFIEKTEKSMLNLWFIYKKMPDRAAFAKDIKVLNSYLKIHCRAVSSFMSVLFPIVKRIAYHNFLSQHPSLFLFDVYKLFVLNECAKANNG